MWTLKSSEPLEPEISVRVQKARHDLLNNNELGFKNIARFDEAIEQCHSHANWYGRFQKLVVIGLGGSSLGTKALCEALYPSWQNKITFLDNVDSHTLDRFINDAKSPDKTGWVLCSKSGTTIEVQALFDYCYNAFKEKHGVDLLKNTAVVTEDKESPLSTLAKNHKIPCLVMPKDVGGRFSVFTPIGLFPLGFLGFDFSKARQGYALALDDSDSVVELAGQLFASQKRGEVNFYSFQYCDRLTQWSLWLQQLWSESLAKSQTRSGDSAPVISTFVPCRGSSDQHSVLQQIVEGKEKKIVGFLQVEESEKGQFKINESPLNYELMKGKTIGELLKVECEATAQAVHESGVPTLVFRGEKLDEESMANLMGLWMLTIGTLGELFDINAFDQPGVESGKVITRRVLSQSI